MINTQNDRLQTFEHFSARVGLCSDQPPQVTQKERAEKKKYFQNESVSTTPVLRKSLFRRMLCLTQQLISVDHTGPITVGQHMAKDNSMRNFVFLCDRLGNKTRRASAFSQKRSSAFFSALNPEQVLYS